MMNAVCSLVFGIAVGICLINGGDGQSCEHDECLTISNLATVVVSDTHYIDFNGEWEFDHCGTRYGADGQAVYSLTVAMCCWDQKWYLTYNTNSQAWVIAAQEWYSNGYVMCYGENFEDCSGAGGNAWYYVYNGDWPADHDVVTSCCSDDCGFSTGAALAIADTGDDTTSDTSISDSSVDDSCDYLDCVKTEKFEDDDLNSYWSPMGCYNGEAYYKDVGKSDSVSSTYLFFSDTNNAWYINDDMSDSLGSSDVTAYCEDESDVSKCSKNDWYLDGSKQSKANTKSGNEEDCTDAATEAGSRSSSSSSTCSEDVSCIEISGVGTVNYGDTHYMDMNGEWEYSHCGSRYGAEGQPVYSKAVEMSSWTQTWYLVYNVNSHQWNIAAQDWYGTGVVICSSENIEDCTGQFYYLDYSEWRQSIYSQASESCDATTSSSSKSSSSSSSSSSSISISSNSNSSSTDSNGNLEWWLILLIVACILLLCALIGVIVYYQQHINNLNGAPKKYMAMGKISFNDEKKDPLLTQETQKSHETMA